MNDGLLIHLGLGDTYKKYPMGVLILQGKVDVWRKEVGSHVLLKKSAQVTSRGKELRTKICFLFVLIGGARQSSVGARMGAWRQVLPSVESREGEEGEHVCGS